MRCLTLVLERLTEHQKLVVAEQLLRKQLFDLAIGVDYQQGRSAIREDDVAEVAPLDIEQQLGFVELLQIDHIRHVRSTVGELEAVVQVDGQLLGWVHHANLDLIHILPEVEDLRLQEDLLRVLADLLHPDAFASLQPLELLLVGGWLGGDLVPRVGATVHQ